jgi:prepilin peptidase CpaA
MSSVSIVILLACLYPIALFWAAFSDLTTMTIPNRLTIGLAVLFVPVALLAHLSLTSWGIHLGLGLAGLVLGMTLFAFRFMGGGDAKLIAAASLWLGFQGFIALLIYTAIFGGVLTLGIMAMRQFFSLYGPKLPHWLGQHLEPKGDIPYGIAICAGGIAALWQSDFMSGVLPLPVL